MSDVTSDQRASTLREFYSDLEALESQVDNMFREFADKYRLSPTQIELQPGSLGFRVRVRL